ncbi:MAG: PAS domain S-box protein [Chloroflexota bacterium]
MGDQIKLKPTWWAIVVRQMLFPMLPQSAYLCRYGLALGLVLVSTLLKYGMILLTDDPQNPTTPFVVFFPAIMLAVWCGGIGPGLVAAILSVFIGDYFFVAPLHTLDLGFRNLLNLTAFILGSLFASLLIYILRMALRQAEEELTERKRVEALLREQREWFEVTLASIGDAVIATDAKGCITLLNPVAAELTGWKEAEAQGQPINTVFHLISELTRQPLANPVEKVLEEGLRVGLANHSLLLTKEGRLLPIENNGAPIRNSSNNLLGAVLVFRDISQRYREEQEHQQLLGRLRAKRNLLEAILQQMPLGVTIAEAPSGKITLENSQVGEIWRHEAIPSESIEEYGGYRGFHKEGKPYQPQDWPLARAITSGEVTLNEELDFQRGDGTWGTMLLNAAPVRNSAGEIVAGVVSSNDITALKKAEEEIRMLNSRLEQKVTELQTLLDLAPIGLAIAEDPECRVIRGNPMFYKGLGIPQGANSSVTAPPEETPLYKVCRNGRELTPEELPMQQSAAKGVELPEVEVDIVYENGKTISYLTSTAPLFDEEGKTRGCISSFLDITQRKRNSERLHFLAEVSKVLAASLDYTTILQNLAHLIVPALADWCVVELVEPLQRLGVAHRDPAIEEELREALLHYPPNPDLIQKMLETGQATSVFLETTLAELAQTHLQSLNPQSLLSLPLLVRGEACGVLHLVSNTHDYYGETELVLAEEIARRTAIAIDNARLYQEAQQAIAVREEFLMVAAHELKTPLTSLSGYAQLLTHQLEQKGELDPARLHRALTVINQQSNKLVLLVSRLLDLSKWQAGGLVLEVEMTELKSLLEQVVAAIQIGNNEHTLILHATEPIMALVDPVRFEQVVINLVTNAIKYSPQGGLVELTLSRTPDEMIRLAVKDQGIGIAPEHREKIFKLFYQAHKKSYSGLGVGLYVSQQIIGLHGGQIEVEFPPEGGTCFIVALPLKIKPPNS